MLRDDTGGLQSNEHYLISEVLWLLNSKNFVTGFPWLGLGNSRWRKELCVWFNAPSD